MRKGRTGRPLTHIFAVGQMCGAWIVLDTKRDHLNRIPVHCTSCEQISAWVEASDLGRGRSTRCRSCSHRLYQRKLRVEAGEKFGRWTATTSCQGQRTGVPVRCDCGHESVRRLVELLEGRSKRCNQCKNAARAHKALVVDGREISMRAFLALPGKIRIHVSHIEVLEEEPSLAAMAHQLVEGEGPGEVRRRRSITGWRRGDSASEALQRALRE